jgi:DNA-binding XRE family transcriptional regulator
VEALPAILRFLGYDPYPPDATTLQGRMLAKRRIMGWSHKKAGEAFGVDKRTWWAWENGVKIPYPRNMLSLEVFLKISQIVKPRAI